MFNRISKYVALKKESALFQVMWRYALVQLIMQGSLFVFILLVFAYVNLKE